MSAKYPHWRWLVGSWIHKTGVQGERLDGTYKQGDLHKRWHQSREQDETSPALLQREEVQRLSVGGSPDLCSCWNCTGEGLVGVKNPLIFCWTWGGNAEEEHQMVERLFRTDFTTLFDLVPWKLYPCLWTSFTFLELLAQSQNINGQHVAH